MILQISRVALLLVSLVCGTMMSVSAQTPSFVPGQVLMRFAAGTPQRATVSEVSRTDPLDLSGLQVLTDELHARVHVPLSVENLGSGYWLTLSVDRQALTDTLEHFFRGENGVGSVSSQDVRFRIGLVNGSELHRAFAGRSESGELASIVDRWTSVVHMPLTATAEADHLIIEVDWTAATLELVERLSALPEVEAAQPNYSQRR